MDAVSVLESRSAVSVVVVGLPVVGAGVVCAAGRAVGTGEGCRVATTAEIEDVSTAAPGIAEATDAAKALEAKSKVRVLAKSVGVEAPFTDDSGATTVKLTVQS